MFNAYLNAKHIHFVASIELTTCSFHWRGNPLSQHKNHLKLCSSRRKQTNIDRMHESRWAWRKGIEKKKRVENTRESVIWYNKKKKKLEVHTRHNSQTMRIIGDGSRLDRCLYTYLCALFTVAMNVGCHVWLALWCLMRRMKTVYSLAKWLTCKLTGCHCH